MEFGGKTVWITGASSGIGKALALEFFRRGAAVVLSARSADKLGELKEILDGIETGRCHVVPCDVTDPESVRRAAGAVKSAIGRLDILVNNAGVSQRSTALETESRVERALFEVNFFGAVAVTRNALPWMIETGGGRIVVIGSMAGKFGFPMRSTYCASKHALQGYFETLRAELRGTGVGVTLVCPGRIRTDISIHSLKGDGTVYGRMDAGQERGMPVERCARIIVEAVRRRRKEILIGAPERLLYFIRRFCPPLFYGITERINPI